MTPSPHPPADRRCQMYIQIAGVVGRDLARCVNPGTHWVQWGGCGCTDTDGDLCEDEYYSWECDGPCIPFFREAA